MNAGQICSEFFKSGGVFQWEDQVHCFWGQPVRQAQRPDEPSLYAPDFFLEDQEPWWAFEHHEKVPLQVFEKGLESLPQTLHKMSWVAAAKKDFSKQFDRIQTWIQNSEVEKSVPFVFSEGSWPGPTEELLAHGLRYGIGAPGGQLYGLWHGEDWLLGRTPETLVRQKGERLWTTMALAGTTSWDQFQNDPEAFTDDPKETREQQLVVQFLQEKLMPLGALTFEPRSVFRAGSLAHLLTPLELAADETVSLGRMIEILHPTPALGCYPSTDWDSRLRDLGWRGRYGAPFGLSLSSHEAQVIVAIRNLQKREGQFVLGTGCGVIQASQKEKEWVELGLKRKSILGIFNL